MPGPPDLGGVLQGTERSSACNGARRGSGAGSETMTAGVFERLAELANANAWLVHRGRFLDVDFLLEVGPAQYLVRIHRGRIEAVDKGPLVMPRWTFALRASEEAWATFWQPVPPPGFHDLIAMIKVQGPAHRGRPAPLHGQPALLQGPAGAAAGKRGSSPMSKDATAQFEPIVGRYLRSAIGGKPHRLYVEEAGEGIPLLCLHTAGADSRQYRGLFNDRRHPCALSRHRLRHALARQVVAAGGLAERRVQADRPRLRRHHHDRGGRAAASTGRW